MPSLMLRPLPRVLQQVRVLANFSMKPRGLRAPAYAAR
jgi:hypothetical protein